MNKKLLARIEKLEQAVRDIWASCSCLTKEIDVDDLPEDEIIYEPEEPEEPEVSDCPGDIEQGPEDEPEPKDQEIEDHD